MEAEVLEDSLEVSANSCLDLAVEEASLISILVEGILELKQTIR